MQLKSNLKHLMSINSIDWFNGLKRVIGFMPDYYLGKGKSSSLVNITWELTHKCNHNCLMCHYGIADLKRKDTQELDFKDVDRVIAQAADLKASFFLTGGEPFLRSDIMDIIKAIKKRGLKCGINTNGTVLDKSKIQYLVDIKLDYIIFSILGSEDIHDKLTGMPGAYKEMVKNLKLFCAMRRKTKIFLNQAITRENLGTLSHMVMLAKEAGVDGIRYQHLSYLTPEDIKNFSSINRKVPKSYELELSCKEYDKYVFPADQAHLEIKETVELAKKNKVNVIFKPVLDQQGIDNWYGGGFSSTKKCIYPWVTLRISPDGDVFCCPIVLLKIGNVKDENIKELLNNERVRLFRNLLKKEKGQFSVCARCCKLYLSPFGRIGKGKNSV